MDGRFIFTKLTYLSYCEVITQDLSQIPTLVIQICLSDIKGVVQLFVKDFEDYN